MKFRLLLILTACLLMFSIWVVLAVVYLPNSSIIEQATNGYATPQASSKEIALVDTSCKKITTTTNTQYFVPTKTTVESSSFLANPPSEVTIGSCTPNSTVCWTFSCAARKQGTGYNVACSNLFHDQVNLWATNGFLTTAQRDQVIIDGNTAWQSSCAHLSDAIATMWSYDMNATLTSSPVSGTFNLSTEEHATFWWCTVDAQVLCPVANSCSSSLPSCNGTSCTTTTWTPTSTNQWWVNWATSCGFTCTNGYTGNNCEIAPAACSPGWSFYLWNGINWDDYGSPTWSPWDGGAWYASNLQWPIITWPQNLSHSIVATSWVYPWRANRLTCAVYNWHITGWSPSPWPDSCYTKFWEYAGNISDGATCSVYHAPATCREGNKLYTIACVGPARVNGTCWCGIGTEDTWPSCLWWLITNISINQTTKSWEFTCQGYNGWTNTSCSEEIAPAWYVHDVWCINSSPSCDWWRYDTFDVSTWIWTHSEQRACADPWSRYQYTWIGTGWWNETYIDASAWTHICMNAC